MRGSLVRFAGPIIGVAAATIVFSNVGGVAGLASGLVAFAAATAISERYWRRRASAEEIRKDLEDRVRNPPA